METISFGPEADGSGLHAEMIHRIRKFCREWMIASFLASIALWILSHNYDARTFAAALFVGVIAGLPLAIAYRFVRFTVGL